jgi:MFS family permease
LLNIRLFKIRGFSIATVVVMIVTSALYGGLFLLPVFLQSPGLRGLGAWEAGLLLFPQALGMTPATLMAGRLYDKVGPRPLMVVGLAMFTQWGSQGVSQMLAQAQSAALAHGSSLAAAKATVALQLYSQVQKAATVQAFDDCFFIAAVACFAAILPTLLIRKGGAGGHAEPVEM